jgi:mannose-1-phosphate guanylyltransferase
MPASDPWLVVMAGGSGTRFWPRSTSRRPKQLLPLGGPVANGAPRPTLLAQTLARFDGVVGSEQRLVITTEALRETIAAEAPGVAVLGEPQGRNTAPCVYWAARLVAERDPRAMMLVMSADHYVADVDGFRRTVAAAVQRAASHDELVTLGVRPTRAETGYGYVRLGQPLGDECHRVDAFVEKPDRARAAEFVASGRYLWNSGMFVWRAETILAAFDAAVPSMREAWTAAGGEVARAYPRMPATSIDYAVMEKADNVVTFPLDCGWEDVGSWASLETLADRLHASAPGGTVLGGDVLAVQSDGNVVDVPGKLVALLGVHDLIVVEHDGALLVASKDRAQDVRLIVDEVKKRRPELA